MVISDNFLHHIKLKLSKSNNLYNILTFKISHISNLFYLILMNRTMKFVYCDVSKKFITWFFLPNRRWQVEK